MPRCKHTNTEALIYIDFAQPNCDLVDQIRCLDCGATRWKVDGRLYAWKTATTTMKKARKIASK